jgi:transglutaminase/protease-like cytokinesis protein 3
LWYQLDVTWDDPTGDGQKDVVYQYFNLTDKQMGKDHQWNHKQGPAATTDFVSTLKSLEKNDRRHASRYQAILRALRH